MMLASALSGVAFAAPAELPSSESLLEPRRGAAAACLDGKLIVMGGANGERILDSTAGLSLGVEGKWKSLAPLPVARAETAAAALGGRVYAVGGREDSGPIAEVLWLSPPFDLWSAATPLAEARSAHALFALGGELVAAGGRGAGGILGSVEAYSPWKKTWTPRARIPVPTSHAAYAELDGEGWIIGGFIRRAGKEQTTDQTWIYDPKADLWRQGPRLPAPRAKASAVSVAGVLFLAGGEDANGSRYTEFVRYDAAAKAWSKASPPMNFGSEMAATACAGSVALIGGWDHTAAGMKRVRYFSPSLRTWFATSDYSEESPLSKVMMQPPSVAFPGGDGFDRLPMDTRLTSPRWGAAVVEFDGAPVLIGGSSKGRYHTYVETLPSSAQEWSALPPLETARANAAVATDGRRMFVCGGLDQGGPLASCEVYEPESREWAPMAPLGTPRSGHGMYWTQKQLCVYGGMGRNGPLATMECWDGRKWAPVLDLKSYSGVVRPLGDAAWIPGESPARSLRSFGGRTVSNGRTMTAGEGVEVRVDVQDGVMSTLQGGILSTRVGTYWNRPLPTPRAGAAAALLVGDLVGRSAIDEKTLVGDWSRTSNFLVAGGVDQDGRTVANLEVLNINWFRAAPMPTPRAYASGFIRGGRFYVAGGRAGNGEALDVVEVYDPKRNRWATSATPEVAAAEKEDPSLFPLPKPAPSRPHDFAVVVGIEGYKDLPPASYAEADAKQYKRHLLSLGVPEENIILLTGKRASRGEIAKYVEEWLPAQTTPDSRVYFIYSGHGAPAVDAKKAYLVPWDGDASFLRTTAYALDSLYGSLTGLTGREIIVILDACFSGTGGRSVLAKGLRPLVTVDDGTKRWPRLTILAASSGAQAAGASEPNRHGLYSYHLLNGLAGQADADGDGHVTVSELHGYARKKVIIEARKEGREQTPTLSAPAGSFRLY